MSIQQISVSNLEELLQELGKREGKGRTFLLFCGDVDEATGESWCSDCVKGKSTILLKTLHVLNKEE